MTARGSSERWFCRPTRKLLSTICNIVAREGGVDIAAHDGRFPGDVAAACPAFEQNLVVVPLRGEPGARSAPRRRPSI